MRKLREARFMKDVSALRRDGIWVHLPKIYAMTYVIIVIVSWIKSANPFAYAIEAFLLLYGIPLIAISAACAFNAAGAWVERLMGNETDIPDAMTLDEAIEHADEKAECDGSCGDNHRQLAMWLRELKALKEKE